MKYEFKIVIEANDIGLDNWRLDFDRPNLSNEEVLASEITSWLEELAPDYLNEVTMVEFVGYPAGIPSAPCCLHVAKHNRVGGCEYRLRGIRCNCLLYPEEWMTEFGGKLPLNDYP